MVRRKPNAVIPLLAALGSLGFGETAFAATYYISGMGSDSNTATQAQSKSTPWAHLPGMVTCADKCAAYAPQPGDRFILRGGDTWGAANLGVGWDWPGTSSSPIYVGADPTWYSGTAWTRPVWSCGGAACSKAGNLWTSCSDYVTLDNIEMTGLYQATNGGIAYVEACGKGQTYEHLYIHGWSHGPGATSDDAQAFGGNGGYDVTGDTYHDNVIDGSDTTKDSLVAFFGSIPIAYDNLVQYVTNGFEASGDSWHDNTVQYLVPCFTGSCHQNFMFHFSPYSGTTVFLYNNVLAHATWPTSGGAPKLWLEGLGACPDCTTYAFNNVIYDQQAGNFLNIADHPAVGYGTFYIYNNTFEVGDDASVGSWSGNSPGPEGQTYTVDLSNNHWVASAVTCTSGCTETKDLVQSVAAANAQGYDDTKEAFAFSPASSSAATVAAGTNLSASCAQAGAALCEDTTYGVGYDMTAHAVIAPARAPHTRPATGAWDIGAYQFAPGSGTGGGAGSTSSASGAGGGGTTGSGGSAGGEAGPGSTGGCKCGAAGGDALPAAPWLMGLASWAAWRRSRRGKRPGGRVSAAGV